MGRDDDQFLVSSSHGYGYVCKFEDMVTRSKKWQGPDQFKKRRPVDAGGGGVHTMTAHR